MIAVPPDFTRFHSKAGELTEYAWEYYGDRLVDVLPALGTHKTMTDAEIATMFGVTPRELFRVHDWRKDIVTLGEVPGEFMREVSEGKLDYTWPAQVNKLLRDGGHDLISCRSGRWFRMRLSGWRMGRRTSLSGRGA